MWLCHISHLAIEWSSFKKFTTANAYSRRECSRISTRYGRNGSSKFSSKGVSRKCNPQEAILIYEGIINAEKRYYDTLNDCPKSVKRTIDIGPPSGDPRISYIEHATYCELSVGSPLPTEAHDAEKSNSNSPIELPQTQLNQALCKKPPRESPKNDRRIASRSERFQRLDQLRRCVSLVDLSRSVASHAHGGYKWPKYRFFSNGAFPQTMLWYFSPSLLFLYITFPQVNVKKKGAIDPQTFNGLRH